MFCRMTERSEHNNIDDRYVTVPFSVLKARPRLLILAIIDST